MNIVFKGGNYMESKYYENALLKDTKLGFKVFDIDEMKKQNMFPLMVRKLGQGYKPRNFDDLLTVWGVGDELVSVRDDGSQTVILKHQDGTIIVARDLPVRNFNGFTGLNKLLENLYSSSLIFESLNSMDYAFRTYTPFQLDPTVIECIEEETSYVFMDDTRLLSFANISFDFYIEALNKYLHNVQYSLTEQSPNDKKIARILIKSKGSKACFMKIYDTLLGGGFTLDELWSKPISIDTNPLK